MKVICNVVNGTFETYVLIDGEYIEELDFIDFIEILNEYLPKNMKLKAKKDDVKLIIDLEGDYYEDKN